MLVKKATTIFFLHFFAIHSSQWTRMEILICYLVGVKYYSHIWFLHTTGLLKHQRPQKNKKKSEKIFEGQTQRPKPKISKFYNFFPSFGSFGVNLMGKAIDLSLKAIKVTVEPYIGQTGNLVWWIRFFLILPFQYQQG